MNALQGMYYMPAHWAQGTISKKLPSDLALEMLKFLITAEHKVPGADFLCGFHISIKTRAVPNRNFRYKS